MKALGVPLRRPIGTVAAYAALLAVGLASLPGLPLGLAPDLEYPRLLVSLAWSDASPEAVEALVTSRVESEVARIPGAREIRSLSTAGAGWVEVTFERGARMDLAEVQLREKLAGLQETLPVDLSPPVIDRSLPEEMDPGAFFVLQAAGDRTPEALRALLEDEVFPKLASVPGVSGLEIYGGRDAEIRLELDRALLARGVLTLSDVTDGLDRMRGRRALGTWRHGERRVPVAIDRPEARAASLRELAIPAGGRLVPLGSVVRVTDGWNEPRSLARLDGRPSVQAVLEREAGSNVLKVAGAVRERLKSIEALLPPDVKLRTVHDESETIRDEIETLARRAGLSLVLIFGVLAVARRSLRAPVVVLVSVMFSAVATFLLFRFAGLGINLVTLSGLALAFGMAVDNSIVLLESIALRGRWRDDVRTLAASREVLFPLLAATATTAVVMTPFLYLTGDLRDYYLPFVLAVVMSLVASLFVALTLTPLMSRWSLAKQTPAAGRRLSDAAVTVYARALGPLLRRPWIAAVTSVALLGGSLWVFAEKVDKGSIFDPDPDTVLRVTVGLPPGSEIRKADELIGSFERIVLDHELRSDGAVEQVEAFVLRDRAYLTVRFHPAFARTTAPVALQEELTIRAATISGAEVSVSGEGPGFSRSRSSVSPAYQLLLRGPDYVRLDGLADDIGTALRRNPRVRNVDTNAAGFFVEDARELVLVPDRERMSEIGITMAELVAGVEPAIAAEPASRRLLGPDGDVTARVRFEEGDTLPVAQLLATPVLGAGIAAMPLSELWRLEERGVPGEIRRRDQEYERAVSFEYRGPRRVVDRWVRTFVKNTEVPAGYTMEDGLGFFLTSTEERQIWHAVALALVLVTMVSAALFESLLLPVVALLSVPLSFVGIPFTFWATGESFDRTAYVGLILLAGIAINNALLLVHRAGRIRRLHGDPVEAARRAAVERIRPILLTTATSVVGLLPLIVAGGQGSATWRSLALSASAGLLASAVFTLLAVPCLFVMLARTGRSGGPKGAVS